MGLALVCWMCGVKRPYDSDQTCPECGFTMEKTHIEDGDAEAL